MDSSFALTALNNSCRHFNFAAAFTADQVVMVAACYFILKCPFPRLCWPSQVVFCQEFKRSIYGCFCQAGQVATGPFIDFGR